MAGAGEASNNAALSNVTGASVNLTRTMEMALLPAFEFGIFCAYDCDYFGPDLLSTLAAASTLMETCSLVLSPL